MAHLTLMGNQHGTACMGMAAATGLDANGEQTGFEGSAPNASLIDVRIGTDAGAGPFENYLLSQEFYESAMNGLQWIIDNKDTAWPGVDESLYGIDIISLSGESPATKMEAVTAKICTLEF